MSYDIWLTVDTGDIEPVEVGQSWNYTSNSSRAWCAAGADLANFDGRPAQDCVTTLALAIGNMESNPDTYRAMDAPNGWGTYETLVPALKRLLAILKTHPLATVHVSR